jgi:hypothetical protein
VVGLFTRTTAVLNLVAAVAALVGGITGPWWLAALGSFGVVGVSGWVILYAKRHPELVAEAQRDELARTKRSIGGRVADDADFVE